MSYFWGLRWVGADMAVSLNRGKSFVMGVLITAPLFGVYIKAR